MKKTRKVLLGADKSKRFEIPFEVVNKNMSVLALPPLILRVVAGVSRIELPLEKACLALPGRIIAISRAVRDAKRLNVRDDWN
jgi:hypothetical protein